VRQQKKPANEYHESFGIAATIELIYFLKKKKNKQNRQHILDAQHMMARDGLRVLALAWGADIDHLCFAGLVGIVDAQRVDVHESIADLMEADVSVKMITGDSRETALTIAKSLLIFEVK
jgi:P-type E1-E2 ATPase